MSKTIEVGNVIRIIKQPLNQLVKLEGLVCVVEKIEGDLAELVSISEIGEVKGGGTIPLSCCILEIEPSWQDAGAIYKRSDKKERREKKLRSNVTELAKQYSEIGPRPGEHYLHVKTGGIYKVICNGIRESTLNHEVVYQNVETKIPWIRPIQEWADGRFVKVQVKEKIESDSN